MKSVIKNITAALIICSSICMVNEAQALVVESASQAMNRTMFEPGFVPGGKATENTVNNTQNNSVETPKEYSSKDIANKLLNTGNEGDLVLLDMVDSYRASLTLSEGQFLAVRLTEDSDEKWSFENRSDGLQFVKREKRGDVVILLYKAVAVGGNRVNLDRLTTTAPVQAVESKILQVRVI